MPLEHLGSMDIQKSIFFFNLATIYSQFPHQTIKILSELNPSLILRHKLAITYV